MKIINWEFEDLFIDTFWRDLFLISGVGNKQNNKPIDIDGMWYDLPYGIKSMYFHDAIELFDYWFSLMSNAEIKATVELLLNSKSIIDIESYIVDDNCYQQVLEYANSLTIKSKKPEQSNNIEEITFINYLKQLPRHEVIMFINGDNVMLSGNNKDKINETYSHMLQSGYVYADKMTYSSLYSKSPIEIFIFEPPSKHVNYSGLS
jgi:hypothetical protein